MNRSPSLKRGHEKVVWFWTFLDVCMVVTLWALFISREARGEKRSAQRLLGWHVRLESLSANLPPRRRANCTTSQSPREIEVSKISSSTANPNCSARWIYSGELGGFRRDHGTPSSPNPFSLAREKGNPW